MCYRARISNLPTEIRWTRTWGSSLARSTQFRKQSLRTVTQTIKREFTCRCPCQLWWKILRFDLMTSITSKEWRSSAVITWTSTNSLKIIRILRPHPKIPPSSRILFSKIKTPSTNSAGWTSTGPKCTQTRTYRRMCNSCTPNWQLPTAVVFWWEWILNRIVSPK